LVAGYYQHQTVLKGVSLSAPAGLVTVILGPNGSGKSSFLKACFGLLPPRQGQVVKGEEDVTFLPPYARVERGMAFLPQGHSVFPRLTVQENLEMGAWSFRSEKHRLHRAIEEAYARYPLLADLRRRLAGSLSGGQQRILELARLTMTDPDLILVDEPSVGVAPNVVDDVYEAIVAWRREGRTVLLVDQNVQAAIEIADRVYVLEYGEVGIHGTREDFSGHMHELIERWLNLTS
jgi:branched-chain amino acid transport system ATP-binding protein